MSTAAPAGSGCCALCRHWTPITLPVDGIVLYGDCNSSTSEHTGAACHHTHGCEEFESKVRKSESDPDGPDALAYALQSFAQSDVNPVDVIKQHINQIAKDYGITPNLLTNRFVQKVVTRAALLEFYLHDNDLKENFTAWVKRKN